MTTSYLPYARGQSLLLPPSLDEWLPQGHLWSISSATRSMHSIFRPFTPVMPMEGPQPAMIVKVLLYGYVTGVFSWHKLARKLHEDVAFRVLGAGNFPAHPTLSDFRALHLKELADLFVQVVKLARECGLVKLGTIAVDGTKFKTNASVTKR